MPSTRRARHETYCIVPVNNIHMSSARYLLALTDAMDEVITWRHHNLETTRVSDVLVKNAYYCVMLMPFSAHGPRPCEFWEGLQTLKERGPGELCRALGESIGSFASYELALPPSEGRYFTNLGSLRYSQESGWLDSEGNQVKGVEAWLLGGNLIAQMMKKEEL